ncbi:response regulator [Pararhodospirillum photometricum]|uniref:Response regulator receiver domain protein (CheY) n=1 Tax=Pararhodospirillum photometricum DSM 122 TaxID=1150469 RepID=H6SJB2_PARPM|nr:response regulator [Pararhodospirillum photometricum]CCG08077.1 Response regulator receiver domain protein (CheY) [Pararhodospirillum photometricum DSM 122]
MMPSPLSLLVIDDDTEIRKAVRFGAEDLGWTVIEAGDGEEGMQVLSEKSVDLVVSDVWMPKIDGIAFIKSALEARPDLRVLAVSGGGMAPAALSLKMTEMYGALDILYKPFTPQELTEKLQALARRG